jgi:hypothetical protein
MDHQEAWLDNSSDLFWDLENIGFSHIGCNSRAANRKSEKKVSHGTHSGYSHGGCRCRICTEAHREYQREFYRKNPRRKELVQ